ncbi:MAG: hypothetical protein JNL96_17340 [Planctomycetaceae bacterium]|nr:hypothetical protein [Planctomycetaceae bacterium]
MSLTAGPDLDAQIAVACGFDYQVVNDVCYVRAPTTIEDCDDPWHRFRASTNWNTARAAAEKIGIKGAGEKFATATALEICAAILSVNR